MVEKRGRSAGQTMLGVICIAIGLGVFAIRFGHDGPYAMPHGGALYGGLGSMLLGGLTLWPGKPRALTWIVLLATPVALFPALYSILGESEEVISLYATNAAGEPVDLRLWIVDRSDGAWVGMGGEKAREHRLDGARLEILRGGERACVVPKLHEDRPTVRAIHAMKVEKYAAARFAGAIGLYPLEATPSAVVLRLDPC